MNIFIGQIYVNVGVEFPFSLRFQKWLGDALSERVQVSELFKESFGADYALGFRISANEDIRHPEIKGPTVFKRDKSIEFTIFLPYRSNDYREPAVASFLLEQLLQSAATILRQLHLDAATVIRDMNYLQASFLKTPGLLDPPSPRIIPSNSLSHR